MIFKLNSLSLKDKNMISNIGEHVHYLNYIDLKKL